MAFQILLQKFLLPEIRSVDKTTSRPVVACDANVKRNASVPKDGIPSGNCLRVDFSILAAIFGCINPLVRLVTRVSKSIPSIISMGSKTLPFDLDIF